MGGVLIYGATGYTGQLVAKRAKEIGMAPILAGRNEAKVSLSRLAQFIRAKSAVLAA